MPAPLAGLAIVGRYIAKHGIKKATQKFGSKRVGQWKGRQTKPDDMKKPLKKNAKGKTYSIMGRKNVVADRAKSGVAGAAGATAAQQTVTSAKANNNKGKRSDFDKAFSAAHNAGKKTFTYKGKKYTTDVKKGK